MKILLATEHPDLRLSLELVLSEEPAVTIAGTASESEGLLALINSTRPAIVLLDWSLPGRPPADVLAVSCCRPESAYFIVLGSSAEDKQLAVSAGADAFVVKGDPPDQLLSAFRTVRQDIHSTSLPRSVSD
jgi:DNA-binding NarL/FixJ family response regulator